MSFAVTRIGSWSIAGLLQLGALQNFTAQTNFERFVNGPVALLLALLAFVVAHSAPPEPHAGPSGPQSRKPGTPTPVH